MSINKKPKLGDFAKSLPKENKTPLQKVVPIIEKPTVKKFLMNMPENVYEELRAKAFSEKTDIKSLILFAVKKTYKIERTQKDKS